METEYRLQVCCMYLRNVAPTPSPMREPSIGCWLYLRNVTPGINSAVAVDVSPQASCMPPKISIAVISIGIQIEYPILANTVD